MKKFFCFMMLVFMTSAFAEFNQNDYVVAGPSQTDLKLGPTARKGDVVNTIILVPGSLSPGSVTLKDGLGSSIMVFPGGANSLTELKPITVHLAMKASNAVSSNYAGWRITTGASISAISIGTFH